MGGAVGDVHRPATLETYLGRREGGIEGGKEGGKKGRVGGGREERKGGREGGKGKGEREGRKEGRKGGREYNCATAVAVVIVQSMLKWMLGLGHDKGTKADAQLDHMHNAFSDQHS